MVDALDILRCERVHDHNVSLRCDFVRNNDDCQCSEGFFDYIDYIYCSDENGDGDGDMSEALIIYSIWSCFLFIVLGLTADSFFCPSLAVIARSMSLSQNVAGVTFLAFGNGASDIFASLAAATQNRPELVISGLFGAGIFVTCAVAGAIMIATPFKIKEAPFLRDIIFYLGAAYWAFVVYYNGQVRPMDAFGFLALYVVYILVVLLVPYFHKKLYDSKCFEASESNVFSAPLPVYFASVPELAKSDFTENTPLLVKSATIYCGSIVLDKENNDDDNYGALANLWRVLSPIDSTRWTTARWYKRTLIVIKSPAVFILNLTVPLVDYDKPRNNWSQLLNAFHCIVGPCFLIFATRSGDLMIADCVSIWIVVFIIGLIGAGVVLYTSSDHEPPKYHTVFGYLGFAISIVWIYIMANEIVNVLKVMGIVLNINDAILGLTILAWGNSIGDFVANFSVSRKGSPMMGISACYGGPLFNLLVGMGLPFTIETFRRPNYIKVIYDPSVTILSIFLFTSLISTMVAMLITRFHVRRCYGFYLVTLYVLFVGCAIYNAVIST